MRRFSLLAICLASILAWSTFAVGQTVADSGATSHPDHITLTWRDDPAITMTITWRTAPTIEAGCVQYQSGMALDDKAQETPATYTDLSTELGTIRLFTATLTGLASQTPYTYRVGSRDTWSDPHTFSTADPDARAVTFLVFSDSQSMPTGRASYSHWHTTLQRAYQTHPEARFFIVNGDLVDAGQSLAHWNAWYAGIAGVIDTIPIMPALGNHEFTRSGAEQRPAFWHAQFHLPRNGPPGLENQAYTFDYGPVHFVALDSQQVEQSSRDILTPQ